MLYTQNPWGNILQGFYLFKKIKSFVIIINFIPNFLYQFISSTNTVNSNNHG